MRLPAYIKHAIRCGPVPKLRDWQNLDVDSLTPGEKVLRFAADYLVFPEGTKIGQPLVLDPLGEAIFADDFESGNTSRWSSTMN